jgi:apolipoprotein N-acyltransferase
MPGGGVAEGQRSGVTGAAQVGGPAVGGLGRLLPVGPRGAVVAAAVGVVAFHVAYASAVLAGAVVLFLFSLVWVSRVRSPRGAFWLGLAMGFCSYAPKLFFFWGIFGPFAISLWLILSVWAGAFVLMAHYAARRFPALVAIAMLPVLWMGLEYFRSELYPLKFAWLTPGFAFVPGAMARTAGVYGVGFFCMALAAGAWLLPGLGRLAGLIAAVVLAGWLGTRPVALPELNARQRRPMGPIVVGIQRENGDSWKAAEWLETARQAHPEGELFVLSEYTFPSLPPEDVLAWCKEHGKYLLAGGVRDVEGSRTKFYDTAFVVGPDGKIVFEQVKAVPIQFMQDGLPAPKQELWRSPWGAIGVCVCYDLSYTRVTDRLVAMEARLLLVPAMDAMTWGKNEHELHGRVGPMRAAEYGVPVVRVCSSGISQIIDQWGNILESAPYPGQGAIFSASTIRMGTGHLPWDRWAAPVCALLAMGYSACELMLASVRRVRGGRGPGAAKSPPAATAAPALPAEAD